MKLIVMESPYAGLIERNLTYARACLRDCLDRGEAPIASHLLYTQPGVLNDDDPNERTLGIAAGIAWAQCAERAAFYVDLGWSPGMQAARLYYERQGISFEERSLGAKIPGFKPAHFCDAAPDRVWLKFSDDGQNVRRWSAAPFDDGCLYHHVGARD